METSLKRMSEEAALRAGALDTHRFAIAGHSFGGATCADLVAADPSFACGVALDPWWCAPNLDHTCRHITKLGRVYASSCSATIDSLCWTR